MNKRKQFFNHVDADFIRSNIFEEIWNRYFKFCFERNPFDKAISRYYYSKSEPRPTIRDYLYSAPTYLLSNWGIYSINDHIVVDYIGRYENINHDLTLIKNRIGLDADLVLPNAKGGYRKSREHYKNILDSKARERIELVCAKEIVAFGYSWNNHVGLTYKS